MKRCWGCRATGNLAAQVFVPDETMLALADEPAGKATDADPPAKADEAKADDAKVSDGKAADATSKPRRR